jgi:nitrogen regulatory protein PII
MKLLILINSKIEDSLEVAEAWQQAGVPGVTIIPSHGLYSLQEHVRQGEVELPRMVASMSSALAYIMQNVETSTNIILSVVEPEMVETLIAVTERVLGDLTQPHNGVVFVLDVERAVGIRRHGGS